MKKRITSLFLAFAIMFSAIAVPEVYHESGLLIEAEAVSVDWTFPVRGRSLSNLTCRFGCSSTRACSYCSRAWRSITHTGIDIPATSGTDILASRAGTVVSRNTSVDSNFGFYIAIDHGVINGTRYFTFYCHMVRSSPLAVGATVTRGQVIGGVGTTGDSTGNHLHFEIRKGANNRNSAVDPLPYLQGNSDTSTNNAIFIRSARNTSYFLNQWTNSTPVNGTNVTTYTFTGHSTQQWIPTSKSNGNFTFRSGADRNQMLNVYSNSSASNGTNVTTWQETGHSTQDWIVEAVSNNNEYVIRAASNRSVVLTAQGFSNTSGSNNVNVQTFVEGNRNQIWQFVNANGNRVDTSISGLVTTVVTTPPTTTTAPPVTTTTPPNTTTEPPNTTTGEQAETTIVPQTTEPTEPQITTTDVPPNIATPPPVEICGICGEECECCDCTVICECDECLDCSDCFCPDDVIICDGCGNADGECNCPELCEICGTEECTRCHDCNRLLRNCICPPPCEICGEECVCCDCTVICDCGECLDCSDCLCPDCECKNCVDCGFYGGIYGLGNVRGRTGTNVIPKVDDALEILKFVVNLDNVIDSNENAKIAARIVEPNKADKRNPNVNDALEILKFVVGLDSVLDEYYSR